MADTIAVMNEGKIEQLGTPERAVRAPADGVRRRVPRQVEPPRTGTVAGDGLVRLGDGSEMRARTNGAQGAISVGVRPEKISLGGRGSEQAPGHGQGVGVHRRRDRGRRRDGGRRADRVPPERRGGRRRPAARERGHDLVGARRDVRRRIERRGDPRMTMRMTRRELVQRGAAGATILSLPGLLAACGGGGGGGGGGRRRAPTRSASRTGSSTSTSTRRRRSRRRSSSSRSRPGSRSSTSRRSTRTTSTSGRSRGRSRRATRSTARSSS